MSWGEDYQLENSDVVIVAHSGKTCAGDQCPIHRKTTHRMRSFPQNWRGDRGIMERICPHGIGHPDPDDVMNTNTVHGCDGCCTEGGFQSFLPKRKDQDGFGDGEGVQDRMRQIDEFMANADECVSIQDSINHEAHKIINGARQTAYGSPTESFSKIAVLWSEVLNTHVTPEQVLLCMIQLKVVRAMNGGERDNFVDIAGYAGLSEMLCDPDADW